MSTSTIETEEDDAEALELAAKSTGAEPEPAEPARQPVAILYLPAVKSKQSVKVFGASGRYSFQRSVLANDRPARIYYDVAVFEREEQDIRQNPRNIVAVCTLLGSPDVAVRAEQSVKGLIDSRKYPAGLRKAALQRLLVQVKEGLAGLGHLAEVVPLPPPAPASPPPAAPAPSASAPASDTDDAPPKAWQAKEAYTEAQLNDLPLEDLRALAAHYKVPGTYRREIIRAWFKS